MLLKALPFGGPMMTMPAREGSAAESAEADDKAGRFYVRQ